VLHVEAQPLKLRDRLLGLRVRAVDGDKDLVFGHEVFSSLRTHLNCQVIYLDMTQRNLRANPGKDLYSRQTHESARGPVAFATGRVSE
jgi:hypothetical protein